jgi:hypothetical protein
MLADPITISSTTFAFDGSWPAASETGLQGKTLNRVEATGSNTRYTFSQATLATLSLSKFEMLVKHQTTASGRVQSLIRVDVGKLDAAGVEHSCSIRLNVDKEAKVTTEHTAALAKAVAAIPLLFITANGATSILTTSIFNEFLNGEA